MCEGGYRGGLIFVVNILTALHAMLMHCSAAGAMNVDETSRDLLLHAQSHWLDATHRGTCGQDPPNQ
jgi:hypothetical protein